MRRSLVAGNWKMNGSIASVNELMDGLITAAADINAEIAVCPTFVHLPQVAKLLESANIKLGAQNLCDQEKGAFTGEISGDMLSELGCQYVLVGHSERRQVYVESDALIARKFAAAKRSKLIPVLCVGETLEEREQGITQNVVGAQINAVLDQEGIEGLKNAVIAYEPVWAIGTGKTASPEQAQEVHAFIRELLTSHNGEVAENTQILYGGSVKAANAGDLFGQKDIDGGLVGGASLKAEEFLAICRAAG